MISIRCVILMGIVCLCFIGGVTISNDGATIVKLLDVVHPAAKTLVEIAKSQDAEVRWDCMTSHHETQRSTETTDLEKRNARRV